MAIGGTDIGIPKARDRKSFTVPATPGNYAEERITFGQLGTGESDRWYRGIMALVENLVPGATLELWLRQCSDPTLAGSAMTDANYFLAGTNFSTQTTAGGIVWTLHAWPGAQLRVKSGGTQGSMAVSAAAY